MFVFNIVQFFYDLILLRIVFPQPSSWDPLTESVQHIQIRSEPRETKAVRLLMFRDQHESRLMQDSRWWGRPIIAATHTRLWNHSSNISGSLSVLQVFVCQIRSIITRVNGENKKRSRCNYSVGGGEYYNHWMAIFHALAGCIFPHNSSVPAVNVLQREL